MIYTTAVELVSRRCHIGVPVIAESEDAAKATVRRRFEDAGYPVREVYHCAPRGGRDPMVIYSWNEDCDAMAAIIAPEFEVRSADPA